MDHQDPDKSPPKEELVISLAGQNLKKIVPQLYKRPKDVTKLHLDNNEILKLEHLEKMPFIKELTMSHNQLTRMHSIHHLKYLKKLDLSYNSIFVMEGIRMLNHLEYLNLAGNKIKSMEKLQPNLMLEYIDLSENLFTSVPNVGELNNLKTLYLHKNKLTNLKMGESYLPKSLITLTLAGNKIQDLAEVSYLGNLPNLTEISFVNNPCVETYNRSPIAFDFRPYLINWCLHLQIVDGFSIDDIERLKAEWLYSQGKGRKFRPGQHAELVDYLMETCPFTSTKLLSESESKLRLVLSKAHQHQRQLQMAEQPGAETSGASELMSRSLDSSLLGISSSREHPSTSTLKQDVSSLTRSLCDSAYFDPSDECRASTSKANVSRSPLPAATKLVPVPESLVSPLVSNPPPMPPVSGGVITPDQVSDEKLQTIKQVALIKREGEREYLSRDPSNVRRNLLNEPQFTTREESLASNLEGIDVTPSTSFLSASEVSSCTQQSVTNVLQQCNKEEKSDVSSKGSSSMQSFLHASKSEMSSSHVEHKITPIYGSVSDAFESIPSTSRVTSNSHPPLDLLKDRSSLVMKDESYSSAVKISKEKSGHILKLSSSVKEINKEMAAICIQKYWRGYQARKNIGLASSVIHHIHTKRTNQHIQKISQDIEIMRASLEHDHRIQILQMQATRALWKKVQDLQIYMKELIHCVTPVGSSSSASVSTQTDVTAVHSPTSQANFEPLPPFS